jgi:hypothetical protein
MIGDGELLPIRMYFHCGWSIQVDPSFESEQLYGGETLRMFDEGERREVYLSSMTHRRWDGRPFTVRDVMDVFPPKEMTGLRYEHEIGDLGGAALWMLGDSDTEPAPVWVLMSIIACPPEERIARCTIVCTDSAYREWALKVWRSIERRPPPAFATRVTAAPR